VRLALISTSEAVDDGYDSVTCDAHRPALLFLPAATLEALVSANGGW